MRVALPDGEVELRAKTDPAADRLHRLLGVGPSVPTALVASVGTGGQFGKGRQMEVAFRLTPKRHSSGGKERIIGISQTRDGPGTGSAAAHLGTDARINHYGLASAAKT